MKRVLSLLLIAACALCPTLSFAAPPQTPAVVTGTNSQGKPVYGEVGNGAAGSVPMPVTESGGGASLPPASVRWQAIIATTGTAVQLQSASFVLTGWVHFCADIGNSGPLFFGNSSVTNTGSGTGNGPSILPGACDNLPATQVMNNLNQFYMNGPIGAWASGYAY